MNSFEAVLHYGMTKKGRPSAAQIRDQFFATVVEGDNSCNDCARLAKALMEAYIVAREVDAEDEDTMDLELLDPQEAEQVFRDAYTEAFTKETGNEVPDGLGSFDFVTYKIGIAYPKCLMVDAGHLLAHMEISQSRALQAYMESDEGKAYLRSQGCVVDD